MSEQPSRVFVAIPDASVSPQWENSFRSVLSQPGNHVVSCLVNFIDDDATDLDHHVASWRAEAEAWATANLCRPVEMVVTRDSGRGYFDTLNRISADIPPLREVVMVSMPSGAQLKTGALSVVTRVFAERPDVDVLRGAVPTVTAEGILTSLGFRDVHDTWHATGAVCEVDSDLVGMQGGMFVRGSVWHRLGRMDPTLQYTGYVDFYSKAASTFQIGKLEAFLASDRATTVTAEDRQSRLAELARLQLRARRRQQRLLNRVLDGDASLNHPLHLSYSQVSNSWSVAQDDRYLDAFGLVEIESGFHGSEGPFPHLGLFYPFRWTSQPRASFCVVAIEVQQRVYVRLRNPSQRQVIALSLNGTVLAERVPDSASLEVTLEISMVADFRIGPNHLVLSVDKMVESGEGRSLGIIVEAVEIIASNVQRL